MIRLYHLATNHYICNYKPAPKFTMKKMAAAMKKVYHI